MDITTDILGGFGIIVIGLVIGSGIITLVNLVKKKIKKD